MVKSNMILFVVCMCQAQRSDFGRLHKNLEILFSETERGTNNIADIRRELEARSPINEDVSKILEELISRQDKLESANQALNQKLESAIEALNYTMLEIMQCSSSYKIIPEQPDLHYMKLGLVLISISHVLLILLVINTTERLIK